VSDLGERFRRHLAALDLAPGAGLVAVSGGIDSMVLLHLLAEHWEAHPLRLTVAHVDHGIHAESGAIADMVTHAAAALGLPIEMTRLALGPRASETRARRARWRWLFETLERLGPGVILTAHHRDDQVETVLMRVLHGSGPAGLTGIAPASPRVVRPLLPFARAAIEEFARARNLPAWDDPANRDPRHERSWLRLEVVPRLRARFPDLDRRILALAAQAALDRAAWDAALEAPDLAFRLEPDGVSVASAPLRAYHTSLAQTLVMAAGRRAGCPIGPGRAARVVAAARRGRSGLRVELGAGWLAETRFDRLAVVRATARGVWRISLCEPAGDARVAGWRVRWGPSAAPGRLARTGWATWLAPGRYEVRPWRPGDRIRPLGTAGSRAVVRCMQETKVGRSDRPQWPVVASQGTVIWVPGVCRSGVAVPAEGTEAWRVDVERG
jgi:tRNA(Ile)-lysidine synthase